MGIDKTIVYWSGWRCIRGARLHLWKTWHVFYIYVHDNTPLKKQLFLSQASQNLEHFPLKWTTKSKEHFNVWRLSFMYNHLTSLLETAFLAHEIPLRYPILFSYPYYNQTKMNVFFLKKIIQNHVWIYEQRSHVFIFSWSFFKLNK